MARTVLLVGGLFFLSTASCEHVVDLIWVKKSERKLYLLKDHNIVKHFPIGLGKSPLGDKQREGDSKTPEGVYFIQGRNANGRFYKGLHISYPSLNDWAHAIAAGYSPGGGIMIHGEPNDLKERAKLRQADNRDWTEGCIAVSNKHMREIWALVPDGTPVLIDP